MSTQRDEIVMSSHASSRSQSSHKSAVEGGNKHVPTSSTSEHDPEKQAPGPNVGGGAAAGAGAGGQGALFSHGFWDKEIAAMRKTYIIGILRVVVLITILIWGIVTM